MVNYYTPRICFSPVLPMLFATFVAAAGADTKSRSSRLH